MNCHAHSAGFGVRSLSILYAIAPLLPALLLSTCPANAEAWTMGTMMTVVGGGTSRFGDGEAVSGVITAASGFGSLRFSSGSRPADSIISNDAEGMADDGVITGTIVATGTGTPLVGVYVSAYSSSGSPVGTSGTTNASGTYTISGLATGTYYVQTLNNLGYVDEVYNDVPCPKYFCPVTTGTGVSVTAGVTTMGISFALTVGGVISGTATDAGTGAPLSGILVEVYNTAGKDLAYAVTSASGVYSVTRLSTGNSGLPTGTYYLRASGASYVDEVYKNLPCPNYSCSPTSGTGVSLTAGATSGGIDFSLDAGGAITGTLTDARTETPLANVSVWVYNASGSNVGYTSSNASGVYTASRLPTGTSYVRTSNKLGYTDELYSNLPCPGGSCLPYTNGTGVTVTARATTSGIDFALAGMIPRDFTGDLKSDVLWRHAIRGDVWLWPMNGGARTAESFVRTVGEAGWQIRGTGDQTGDGKADVLWRHAPTGMVYLWTMNGSSIQAETYVGTVDPAYDIVGTGDYNGDGKSDLLWRHLSNGELWVWLMNGTTIVSATYVTTVDPGYAVVGSGDLNGDGKADIVWRHQTAGDVWVWLMNGATPTSMTYVTTVGELGYQIVGVADHTGDGKSDILWHHSTRGEVWLWPMNGATLVSQSYVATVPDAGYRIVGNGDYNGDGKADILWHHNARGEVWVWLMNGAVWLEQHYVGSVPDVQYQIVR